MPCRLTLGMIPRQAWQAKKNPEAKKLPDCSSDFRRATRRTAGAYA